MYQLAQVNIARLLGDSQDPKMQDFFNAIAEINTLAETSEGFVWRFEGTYGNDDTALFNMSVWQSIDHLAAFVYRSFHRDIMRRKDDWTRTLDQSHLALWWIKSGDFPTAEEGIERLAILEERGPSEAAFTFTTRFPKPEQ